MGIKIESLYFTLSSEGIMKKDYFKINNLNIYWEQKAKILIPSELLYNSIINGELKKNYYENIKKLNFQNFKYIEETMFIMQNFNCSGKLGTLALSSGNVDIFGKKNNNQFKLYCQLSSNEINLNIFPELINIYSNFRKFIHEFNILEQVQDFKPMKKPYDKNNIVFKNFMKKINEKRNTSLIKTFSYKRKMLTRDWLFYFYWCQKCKSSVFARVINPIRLEFNRFYGLCFNQYEEENNKLKETNEEEGEINPDSINLNLSFSLNLKGVNINIHSFIKNKNKEYFSIKIIDFESHVNSSQNLFDLNINIKNMNISPNKIIIGENLIINPIKKSIISNKIKKSNIKKNEIYISEYNIEDNSGLFGLVKKYNPNYEKKVKMIDDVLGKIETESRIESRVMSEIDSREFVSKFQSSNKKFETNKQDNKNNLMRSTNIKNMTKNYSFVDKIILNYEGTPIVQKLELKKQKKEFSISQAINDYNNRKSRDRISLKSMVNHNKQITGVLYSKEQNNTKTNDIIFTGKKIPLNFIDIYSSDSTKCFIFKYNKNTLEKITDNIILKLESFRINLIEDYIYECLNILSNYKSFITEPIINSIIKKYEFGIKTQKELYKMQRYIYDYFKNKNAKKENEQIKEYKKYLKKELNKCESLGINSDNFEINYLINLISKGFDIKIDLESIEFIHYGNDKKYNGKGIIPTPKFHLKILPNYLKFNFFDSEFELNNLENNKSFISNFVKNFEDKLKKTNLYIEPYFIKAREELDKQQINKKFKKEYKKLENILSFVKENINKEKKKNKEEAINKNNDKKIIFTIKDNCDDEDLNDLNFEESLQINKIKVKNSKIPNHFYSETVIKDKKIDKKNIDINENMKESNTGKNKCVFMKKNNLPKVYKK